jgi:hypothetical protein
MVKYAAGSATDLNPAQIPRQTNDSFGKPSDRKNAKDQLCPSSAKTFFLKRSESQKSASDYETTINDDLRVHNIYVLIKPATSDKVQMYLETAASIAGMTRKVADPVRISRIVRTFESATGSILFYCPKTSP